MAPRSPMTCPTCNKTVSYANYSRHIREVCKVHTPAKGAQEWCPVHGWFASSTRKRHYETHHPDEAMPARKDCTLRDPVTGKHFTTDPARKRDSSDFDDDEDDGDTGHRSESGSAKGGADSDDDLFPKETTLPLQIRQKKRARHADQSSRATSTTLVETTREEHILSLDVAEVGKRAWDVHLATIARLKDIDEQQISEDVRTTRLGYELPIYRKIIENTAEPKVYSYQAYLETVSANPEELQEQRHCYMVCTKDEAEELFLQGKPQINVLVPKSRRPRITMQGSGQFFDHLHDFPHVDVHVFDKVKKDDDDEDNSHLQTVQMSPSDAIDAMNTPGIMPINLLDLDARIPNPVPDCLATTTQWSLLSNLKDTNHSGKQATTYVSDLSAGAAFHVCGKEGSFSLPHMDNHGVDTTIVVEDGVKLWYTFPRLTDDEREAWGSGNDWAPPSLSCYPVLIEPGDLWFQSQGTVHAPYSVTNCLITGTKHWHPTSMLAVLQQSLFERQYPSVTNEDEAGESYRKLRLVEKLWKDRAPAWRWGSDEDLVEFSTLMDNKYEEAYACQCTKQCTSKSCSCFIMNKSCGKFCHPKNPTCERRQQPPSNEA